MECPVCNSKLTKYNLFNDLNGLKCSECNGKWLRSVDYFEWYSKLGRGNKKGVNCKHFKDANHEDNIFNRKSIFEKNVDKTFISENRNFKEEFYNNEPKDKDFNKAKICPECKHILIKYKVDIEKKFYIEHCGTCSGVWFDLNKWELIIKYNLHINLYDIFTEHSQRRMREVETKKYFDKKYNLKFGRIEYEKLKDIKKWIDNNENKSEILGFLLKVDPYKAK